MRIEPEIEQLLKEQQLTSDEVDQECTDEFILKIYRDLEKWEQVSLHLGLKSVDIETINNDFQSSDLKRHKALDMWKSINLFTGTATYRMLLRALLECGCRELALKVCELIKCNS